MANIKVSEMTEATSFDDGDYTMIVQANQNKKISKENMLSDIPTIQNNISTINTNIGNLSNLATEDKTSIVNSINELKNAEIYSTEEIKTNKVWINGKPIYRKVYQFTTPSNANQWTNIGYTGVNIEAVIEFSGVITENTRINDSINFGEGSYYVHTVITDGDNKAIRMIQNGWPSLPCIIIVEYTKTTD